VRHAVAGLVLEPVAGAAAPGAFRATALDHEIGNHAVEVEAVVKPAPGEVDEVGHGQGGVACQQFHGDDTLGGVDDGGQGHGWGLQKQGCV